MEFYELFVKTGRIDRAAGQILERNFESRQSADYDMEACLSETEAQLLVDDARVFYDLTIDYFNQNPIT